MQGYLAVLTIVLFLGMVLTRVVLMRRSGIRAMHFGNLDKTDFLIPPFALFYFYTVFAAAFNLPLFGASVINCCYAASGIAVSLTMTKTVDCANATLLDTQRTIADGKISLNVNRRVISPACIAGVLISSPNFNAL